MFPPAESEWVGLLLVAAHPDFMTLQAAGLGTSCLGGASGPRSRSALPAPWMTSQVERGELYRGEQ